MCLYSSVNVRGALGAVGWFGFGLLTLAGITALSIRLARKETFIKKDLYEKDDDFAKSWHQTLLKKEKKVYLIILIVIIINIFTLRFCMWGGTSFWSLLYLFIGVAYWLIIIGFITGTMKLFISSYYFVKFSKQYKSYWKVTDEQWYGKRKARIIASKNKIK